MAAPTVTATLDDFNRANATVDVSAPGSLWAAPSGGGVGATTGSLVVTGNQLGTSLAGFNGRTATSFGPAFDLLLTVAVAPTSYTAIFWSMAGGGTTGFSGYALTVGLPSSTAWQIRRYTAGALAATPASATAAALAVGDTIWIHQESGVEQVYCARSATPTTWTLIASATDATYDRSGPWGFEIGDTACRFDNLCGGTVVGGATTFNQTCAAASAITLTTVRQARKTSAGSAAATPRAVKSPLKALAGSGTATASLVAGRAYLRALTASVSGSASLARAISFRRTLGAAVTGSTTASKRAGKASSATATGNASTSKQPRTRLAAASAAVASTVKGFAFNLILSASASGSGAAARAVRKLASSPGLGAAATNRRVAKPTNLTISVVPSVAKRAGKAFAAGAVGSAAAAQARLVLRTLAAQATGSASVKRALSVGLAVAALATATVARVPHFATSQLLNLVGTVGRIARSRIGTQTNRSDIANGSTGRTSRTSPGRITS